MFILGSNDDLPLDDEVYQEVEDMGFLEKMEYLTGSDKQLFIFTSSHYNSKTKEYVYGAVVIDGNNKIVNRFQGKTTDEKYGDVKNNELAAEIFAINEVLDWLLLNKHRYGSFIIYTDNEDILNAGNRTVKYNMNLVTKALLMDIFAKTTLFKFITFASMVFFEDEGNKLSHIKVEQFKSRANEIAKNVDSLFFQKAKNNFDRLSKKKKELIEELKDIESENGVPGANADPLLDPFDEWHMINYVRINQLENELRNCEIELNLLREHYGFGGKTINK